LFRLGLTAELRANERLALLSEVRTENLDPVSVYALYLRLRPWSNHALDIQAGRIPPVFGSFARRRYAADNPLIGYPLAYQYLTTLRADAVPSNADELLARRGEGWHVQYSVGSAYAGPGSPLISALRWDTGIEARVGSVGTGVFEAAFAVTQGTLADPRTHDSNDGKQVSARVAFRPTFGLIVGASAASGDFLSHEVTDDLTRTRDRPFRQQALGLDLEWSRGYWIVRAEGVYSSWDMPAISEPFVKSPVHALGGFAELRYKLAPGLYVAARADHLGMNPITGSTQTLSWDAPVTRIEAGLGYSPIRGLWLKGVYQHDWRDGGSVRSQGIGAVQASYGF
ncbi:MAG: hypothetical protein L3K06_05455, partial [Thermoplasmata archaeon]|nr:hypothetical protein [Thermoplasmata archaeon]